MDLAIAQVVSHSLWKPGFASRVDHMGPVVDKIAQEQVYFPSPSVVVIQQLLHIHSAESHPIVTLKNENIVSQRRTNASLMHPTTTENKTSSAKNIAHQLFLDVHEPWGVF